ncbi:subtilisin-like protease SBT4.10 [Quercus suber]|uniref:subtilisin-like protease SBT4.10 n=1 Tax=Quercus suber TaxID=58331 RepID=UPI0032E01C0C
MIPDLSAPGVDTYSPITSPSFSPDEPRRVNYNIQYGTSTACPHVSGAAAYVQRFHPDWSPSAIKSALMATTLPMSDTKSLGGEFAYGSGHVNPVAAVRPGVVYEALKEDYIIMFVTLAIMQRNFQVLSGDNNTTTCPKLPVSASPKDLNYPSMAAEVSPKSLSIYKAKIVTNSKVDIKVEPVVLTFKSLNEKISFVVSVSGSGLPAMSRLSASLVWSDVTYSVRSPIIVHNQRLRTA